MSVEWLPMIVPLLPKKPMKQRLKHELSQQLLK